MIALNLEETSQGTPPGITQSSLFRKVKRSASMLFSLDDSCVTMTSVLSFMARSSLISFIISLCPRYIRWTVARIEANAASSPWVVVSGFDSTSLESVVWVAQKQKRSRARARKPHHSKRGYRGPTPLAKRIWSSLGNLPVVGGKT